MALFVNPRQFQNDKKGRAAAGATYTFSESGGGTPKDTYADAALTIPNSNPVVADGAGRFPKIYLATDIDYRVVYSEVKNPSSFTIIWTEDGVSGPLDNTDAITSVDSVADLAGLVGSVDGQQVSVGEFRLGTNAGSGKFAWSASGTHNGGTFIDPDRAFPIDWSVKSQRDAWFDTTGGLVSGWQRPDSGRSVEAAWFGDVGDGDPVGVATTGSDNTESLNAAATYLYEKNYNGDFNITGAVILDAGTHDITGEITCYPNLYFIGKGIDVTEVMNQSGNSTGYILFHLPDNGLASGERVNRNFGLANMSVNGNDNNTTGAVQNLKTTNAIYCFFNNVELKQSRSINIEFSDCSNFIFGVMLVRDSNDSGIFLDSCSNMTFGSSVTIRTGSKWGVEFPSTSISESTRISFNGTRFSTSADGAIGCFDGTRAVAVLGCSFVEGGGGQSALTPSAIYIENAAATKWVINGNQFERTFGRPVWSKAANTTVNNNQIDSCRHDGIYLEGDDSIAEGNTIIDAGYLTDNTYDGIFMSGDRSIAKDNKTYFKNNVGGSGQILRYGVNATGSNCEVVANKINTGSATIGLNVTQSSSTHYENTGICAEMPFVIAGMSADQTGILAATTVVDFDTESKDKQGDYNTSTQTFTAPADGYYHINCTVDVQNVGGGTTQVFTKFENNTAVKSLFNIQPGAYEGTIPIQGVLYMDKGDAAQVKVQFTGGSGEVNDRSYLHIERADI